MEMNFQGFKWTNSKEETSIDNAHSLPLMVRCAAVGNAIKEVTSYGIRDIATNGAAGYSYLRTNADTEIYFRTGLGNTAFFKFATPYITQTALPIKLSDDLLKAAKKEAIKRCEDQGIVLASTKYDVASIEWDNSPESNLLIARVLNIYSEVAMIYQDLGASQQELEAAQ